MAELTIHTGADTAMSVYNLVQEWAKQLKTVDGETRTLAQLRADLFADIFLHSATQAFHPASQGRKGQAPATLVAAGNGGTAGGAANHGARGPVGGPGAAGPGGGSTAGGSTGDLWGGGNVKAFVSVTIPLATAAGGDEPGELAGYGPIPAGMARRVAGLAKSWLPVITDEHDKAVIVAREMRHPPEWLKREIRLRDRTCRGLGCRTNSNACELDHTLAWQDGGKTELNNIVPRCKPDHISKHTDGWHTTQEENGVLNHHTRTGHSYTSYPDGSWISHGIKPPPPPPPDPFTNPTPPPF